MNQLTLRGFDEELAERIRRLSEKEGISLNKAALKLLKKGSEIEDPSRTMNVVGSSLDHFIGTWSDEEAEQIMTFVNDTFGYVDEDMWK